MRSNRRLYAGRAPDDFRKAVGPKAPTPPRASRKRIGDATRKFRARQNEALEREIEKEARHVEEKINRQVEHWVVTCSTAAEIPAGCSVSIEGNTYEVTSVDRAQGVVTLGGSVPITPGSESLTKKFIDYLDAEGWSGVARSVDNDRYFDAEGILIRKPKPNNLTRPDGEWRMS